MKDQLPVGGPHYNESGIINLQDSSGLGTHWTAYRKRGKQVFYFDSFGDLQPPIELMRYFNVPKVKYNYDRYQDFDTHWCGHLCLKFLCGSI